MHARSFGSLGHLAAWTVLASCGCSDGGSPVSGVAGSGGAGPPSSAGTSTSGGVIGTGAAAGSPNAGTTNNNAAGAPLGGGGRTGNESGQGGAGNAGTGAQPGNAGSAPLGGSAGAGGTSGNVPSGDPDPSTGCTATPTTTSCNTQGSPCTLDVAGNDRQFWVQLPDNYDPKHPYPVVFEYHPLGGNGWQGLTMYQVRPKFPNAIYVSPDGLKSGQYQGFSNTNGEDEALTRAMMTELEGKYCVDKARYFATGFSFGGSMSYTAACNMSDVFRAIGAMSGAPISGATCTSKKPARPVAVWATHGDADQALPIDLAEPIIESFVKNNGCTMESKAVDPSPCIEYQGCTAGAPVTWCLRQGDDHSIPSFAAGAIAKFFGQF